jgi:hypothetical protein
MVAKASLWGEQNVHSTASTAKQTALFDNVRCEFVPAASFGTPAWYALTVVDAETGVIMGRRLVPANIDGTPPQLTTRQLIELVGGGYRLACVRVDRALDRVAEITDTVARQLVARP